jgi:hypothetical protein
MEKSGFDSPDAFDTGRKAFRDDVVDELLAQSNSITSCRWRLRNSIHILLKDFDLPFASLNGVSQKALQIIHV